LFFTSDILLRTKNIITMVIKSASNYFPPPAELFSQVESDVYFTHKNNNIGAVAKEYRCSLAVALQCFGEGEKQIEIFPRSALSYLSSHFLAHFKILHLQTTKPQGTREASAF
jgi:hypothetical protein